jgi:hypothetical protein
MSLDIVNWNKSCLYCENWLETYQCNCTLDPIEYDGGYCLLIEKIEKQIVKAINDKWGEGTAYSGSYENAKDHDIKCDDLWVLKAY